MCDIQRIKHRLSIDPLSTRVWGLRGPAAVERIECGLDVSLDGELRTFVNDIGNLMVAPFEIVLGGDEAGTYSAVTQTQNLWRFHPDLVKQRALQLLDHAGQVYIYFLKDQYICAYDSFRLHPGEETGRWDSFGKFIEWLLDEANNFQNG